jgi:hypothetical protein
MRRAIAAGRWILAGAALAGLAGCAGSPGYIQGAATSAAFVREEEQIYVVTAAGLVRMRLDGGARRSLFPPRYHVLDLSADGAVFVLGDSETNLYLGGAETGSVARIPELDRRAGEIAVSPDSGIVAATRHADFSLPQAMWSQTEDDRVYVIRVADRTVRIVEPSKSLPVSHLAFSEDGRALWIELEEPRGASVQQIDLATLTRSEAAAWPKEGLARRHHRAPPVCAATGAELRPAGLRGDEGIDLVAPRAPARRLATVVGRERGFHDYLPTVDNFFFSRTCNYAVFSFLDRVWAVDVRSGAVGPIAEGYLAFPDPRGRADRAPWAGPAGEIVGPLDPAVRQVDNHYKYQWVRTTFRLLERQERGHPF